MRDKTLVIMAAGMGSRYGGAKQIDFVDNREHTLIDYSLYDAERAGFNRVIFIIREEIFDDFNKIFAPRINKWKLKSEVVFQKISENMAKNVLHAERAKPWGTAHAIACLEGRIRHPFGVINADDYYGGEAFEKLSLALEDMDDSKKECCMIGYKLKNTLSENGGVSRGVCHIDNGFLIKISEKKEIIKKDGLIYDGKGEMLAPNTTVSMNMWGLLPRLVSRCREDFYSLLLAKKEKDLLDWEFFLPDFIFSLIDEGSVRVRVIDNGERWYGVTYKEDKNSLSSALAKMVDSGLYPEGF